MDRRLLCSSGSSGKVRKLFTSGASTMIIESGCVFNTRGRRGRRKNTFIKITRDHRNVLVYVKVQMVEGERGMFNRMAGRDESSFFSSFPMIK